MASTKLDTAWGYRVLRQEFPFVARLADKKRFEQLVSEIRTGRSSAERRVERLIEREQGEPASPAPGL
jgi:hypothetical protein